ncbi:MAG: LytTR family DNA-binding domain-containing protein [Coprobacillus sp.]
MKINVIEDKNIQETEITIKCYKKSEDIDKIVQFLEMNNQILICKKGKDIFQILIDEIIYIESVDERTFVYLQDSVYENNCKIYELEERLKECHFIRISKSCILHLKFLKSVRAMLNGKYEATLLNDEKLIISRNYMAAFRKEFGI